MITEIGEYKGSKVITIKKDADDRYPFSFGFAKAKAILACLDDIRKFVDDCQMAVDNKTADADKAPF